MQGLPISARGNGICMVDYFGRTMVANLPPNVRVGVINDKSGNPCADALSIAQVVESKLPK